MELIFPKKIYQAMRILPILKIKKNDHPEFIQHCETLIQRQLQIWKPKTLIVLEIRFCFDSGYCFDIQKSRYKDHFKDIFSFSSRGGKLTITRYMAADDAPFSIYERNYRGYIEISETEYIKKRKQEECKMFQRDDIESREYYYKPLEDAMIVWYSRKSAINKEGALMFHFINPIDFQAFHVTLNENESWGVSDAFGITKADLEGVF